MQENLLLRLLALTLAIVILITPSLPIWAKAMSVFTILFNSITSLPIVRDLLRPRTPWVMTFLRRDTPDDSGKADWLPYLSLPIGDSTILIQIIPHDKQIDLSGYSPRFELRSVCHIWDFMCFRLRRLIRRQSAIYQHPRATPGKLRLQG